MMANLDLKGTLNLMGSLTLEASGGGKVTVDGKEILVEVTAPAGPPQATAAPPVILPPPPASPTDPAPTVFIVNSFNKTVKVGASAAVAQGLVMQGSIPSWPGMVLPSQNNSGPVTANGLPLNVLNDQAIIFPSGGSASFTTSGQL
jgi:hypothetical protein